MTRKESKSSTSTAGTSKLSWRQKAHNLGFLPSTSNSSAASFTSTSTSTRPTRHTSRVSSSSNATSAAASIVRETPHYLAVPPEAPSSVPIASRPRDRSDFNIVIICALKLEAECVYDALDKVWDSRKYGQRSSDDNAYSLGAIGGHNVVIIHMPGMGTDRAAVAAANLRSSFRNITLALVVGICGGMPYGLNGEEIVLGDVIVSEALIRYDFGRQYPEGFERKSDIHDILGPPSEKILALVNKLSTKQHKVVLQNNTSAFLHAIRQKAPEITHPGLETDVLYRSSYPHRHHRHQSSRQCRICGKTNDICQDAVKTDCETLGCDPRWRLSRKRLTDSTVIQPQIHFGVMGSGNTVMKSGYHRDALGAKEGIIAVEMEGAGVWRYGPTLVIKGVCDYADSHKRKGWQRYAAATAAACTKAFLLEWTPEERLDSTGNRASPRTSSNTAHSAHHSPHHIASDEGDSADDDYETTELTSAHQSLLRLLNDFDPQTQLDFIPARNKSTLTWLKDAPQLDDWIKSDEPHDSILWLCGGVGRGKSVAAKYLVEAVQARQPESLVLFFFCDGNDVLRKSGDFMFRSLLYQLLTKSHTCATKFFRYFGDKVSQALEPDPYEYTWWLRLLLALALLPPKTEVLIIIDAIDEINTKDRQAILERTAELQIKRDRRSAIRQHHPIEVSTATNNVKYLVTSRPWQMIADRLTKFPVLEMSEQNTALDIQHYIGDEVRHFGRTESFPDAVMNLIVSTIVLKAEAMFVWAHLAWEQFKMIDSDWNQEILDLQLENLKSLPTGLRSLYRILIERLRPSPRALQILEWIIYSARPLLLTEMEIAISIKDSSSSESMLALPFDLQRSVSRLLGPLVRFQDTDQSFHLCHLSVKEFFEYLSQDPHDLDIEFARRYAIDAEKAHTRLGKICFKYLSFDSIPWGPADGLLDALGENSVSDLASKHKFLEYTTLYWDYHFNIGRGEFETHDRSISLERKQERIQKFWSIEGADVNTIHSRGFRLLHFAALWSWDSILLTLCNDDRTDILAVDDRGFSALYIACWFGLETAATTLIKRGAWQSALKTASTGRNVLDLTLKQDMEIVACEILNHLDDIKNFSKLHQDSINRFFLEAIELEWRKAVDVVLRSSRVRFDHYNKDQQGVLHLCAKHGFVDALDEALSQEVEVDKRDIFGQTALHIAVAEESSEIVEILLESGADPNCTDNSRKAAIHFAMSIDKVHYVQLLLQNGADVNQGDAEGRYPIHLAALFGQLTVFNALLEIPNIDLRALSKNGKSVIHWAAKGRSRSVLSIIIQSNRFDRTVKDQYGRNVLHIAAPWADPHLISRILKIPGLDIASLDLFGQSVLHKAVANPDASVLSLIISPLLKKGVNIGMEDKYGNTCLQDACIPGKGAHVKTLLKYYPYEAMGLGQEREARYTALAWGAIDVLVVLGWSEEYAEEQYRYEILGERWWLSRDDRQMEVSKALSSFQLPDDVKATSQMAFSLHRIMSILGLRDIHRFENWLAGSNELSPISPFSDLSPNTRYWLIEATIITHTPDHHQMGLALATQMRACGDTRKVGDGHKNFLGRLLRDIYWENEPPEIILKILRLIDVRLWSLQEFKDSIPQMGDRVELSFSRYD